MIIGSRAWHAVRRARVLELKDCASRHILRSLVAEGLVEARAKGVKEATWEDQEIDKINAIIQRARHRGKAGLRPRGKERAPAFHECLDALRTMLPNLSPDQARALKQLTSNLR
jgi:hypothetical protein